MPSCAPGAATVALLAIRRRKAAAGLVRGERPSSHVVVIANPLAPGSAALRRHRIRCVDQVVTGDESENLRGDAAESSTGTLLPMWRRREPVRPRPRSGAAVWPGIRESRAPASAC